MTIKKGEAQPLPEANFKREFGHKLKFLRKKNRMTQEETAGGLGMNYRHYQDIEAGKSDLKVSSLIKIAGYFNLQIDELVDLRDFNKSADNAVENATMMMRELGNFLLAPLTLRDMTGIIIAVNKATLTLGGYKSADVENKNVLDFTPPHLVEYYRKVIEDEQKGIFKPVVFKFYSKDNELTEVIYYPVPIFNSEGKPVAILACTIPAEMQVNVERPPEIINNKA